MTHGISTRFTIPNALVWHHIFRSIGTIILATCRQFWTNTSIDYANVFAPPFWVSLKLYLLTILFQTTLLSQYAGEIFIDSFMLLKLERFCTDSHKRLYYKIGCVTYGTVIVSKITRGLFMMISPFTMSQGMIWWLTSWLDVPVILTALCHDVYCCTVILWQSKHGLLYASSHWKEFGKTLVTYTEVRLFVITTLQVLAFIGICLQFSFARNIYVNTVYTLYYVDYILMKMASNESSERHPGKGVALSTMHRPIISQTSSQME
jgi:hypothetical protein